MQETYKVKTGTFEGPLELLVDLIEKKKLAISEISLSNVTDDFIAYIKELGSLPLGYTANFIITAATLVLIKSKSLLPDLFLTDEEEENISDLKKRLLLYKLYRSVAEKTKLIFGKKILWKRQYPKIMPIFVPDKNISVAVLHEALKSAVLNVPKKESVPEAIIQKAITIEEMMGNLTERITQTMSLSFKKFSNHGGGQGKDEKVFVIVSFLAILELVKQGIVAVKQESQFEDIYVEKMTIESI